MTTPIRHEPTATLDQGISYVKTAVHAASLGHPPEVTAYVRELWRLCQQVGYDPAVLLAQSCEETGVFTSVVWQNYLNPAGLGIFGGSNRQGIYANGVDAARAQIVHMAAYISGYGSWASSSAYVRLDPGFDEAARSEHAGTINNVEDLGHGVWATDPKYAEKILGHYHAIVGTHSSDNAPDTSDAPKNLLPDIIWMGTENSHARPGNMLPIAWCNHMTGDLNLDATLSWFQDHSSDASSHFVVDRDGTCYQFVSTTRAAWTNGDYNAPRHDIPWLNAAIERCNNGLNNLNDFFVTIEYVADQQSGFTKAQYQTGTKLSRYVCHPEVYDICPDRATQDRHSDINSVSRGFDPGPNFDLAGQIKKLDGDPTNMDIKLKGIFS